MQKQNMNSEHLEKRYKTDIKSAQGVVAMTTMLTVIYIIRRLFTGRFDFYFCTAVTEFLLKAAQFSPEYRGALPNAAAIAGIVVYIGLFIAAVILSQKKVKLLWFSLALYTFDTVFLLAVDLSGYFGSFAPEYLIDIIFHLFILVFLVVGIHSDKKLEKLKN